MGYREELLQRTTTSVIATNFNTLTSPKPATSLPPHGWLVLKLDAVVGQSLSFCLDRFPLFSGCLLLFEAVLRAFRTTGLLHPSLPSRSSGLRRMLWTRPFGYHMGTIVQYSAVKHHVQGTVGKGSSFEHVHQHQCGDFNVASSSHASLSFTFSWDP